MALSIPAPSMAQVHTPQGPSLFWATLAPHASASVPIKCPAYKTIFPVRLLQTLHRGRHGKILGLTPGTRSEDQLLSHLPCSCIIPAPSISMVHVTPPSSCLQEHRHLQDTSSNLPRPYSPPFLPGLLSSAQDSTPGLCFVGLRPGTLPGVQGHPSSACLTSALHDD